VLAEDDDDGDGERELSDGDGERDAGGVGSRTACVSGDDTPSGKWVAAGGAVSEAAEVAGDARRVMRVGESGAWGAR
jgi:hypothetical protein